MADQPTNPELALALGISREQVSKYIRRGMPRNIEAAALWRAQNIAPRRGGLVSPIDAPHQAQTRDLHFDDAAALIKAVIVHCMPELLDRLPTEAYEDHCCSVVELIAECLWPFMDTADALHRMGFSALRDRMLNRLDTAADFSSSEARRQKAFSALLARAEKRFATLLDETRS